MEVVLLRHGTTELNKARKIQGSRVDPSLSEDGRAYAEKAAKNFDASKFDAVYVSPLKRAQETARIFVGPDIPIKTDKRLEELDYGDWDGKSSQEFKKLYPDAFDHRGLLTDNMYKYNKNAETRKQFEERLADFFDELYKKNPDKKILVVCHGVVSRMIVAHYLTNGDISYFDQMENCGLAKLHISNDQTSLVFWNRVLA
ncbi:histidine phosphatase family protein [Lactobacillus sp. PV034]|uniref:histidine phosphatase family protein n=1 Tax=Lactobacillus sp. PV034 TaxID=2594495 RepID=UPI00223FB942|nr:histidine phosphatase family protein [Lactobacillus sp. PV034]QNQ81242.1 histidine phosphatase family protein [Lactobacillus sp. PV034]